MIKSVCCGHGKMFLIYNLFYINFSQVFSIKCFCKPSQSPSVVLFGDHYGNKGHQALYSVFYPCVQYGGPDCFYNHAYMYCLPK